MGISKAVQVKHSYITDDHPSLPLTLVVLTCIDIPQDDTLSTTQSLLTNNTLFLRLRNSSWIININTLLLELNLSHRPNKPLVSPQEPDTQSKESHDTDGDGRVIEGLRCHGIECWETEDDCYERDLSGVSLAELYKDMG